MCALNPYNQKASKLAVGATKLNPIPHAPHSQAGIYNGALGSVFGVLFPRDEPTTAVPSEAHALTLGLDRTPAAEMPIVLVQMDRHGDKGYKGEAFFKDRDGKPIAGLENVVPFTAKPQSMGRESGVTRYQLPLTPAHASTIHSSQVRLRL